MEPVQIPSTSSISYTDPGLHELTKQSPIHYTEIKTTPTPGIIEKIASVLSRACESVNMAKNRAQSPLLGESELATQSDNQTQLEAEDPPPSYERPRQPTRPAAPDYYVNFPARPKSDQFKDWEEYRQADIKWLNEYEWHAKEVYAQYRSAFERYVEEGKVYDRWGRE